ncbi:hypothetical protein L1887_54486 [Cichorium endivia]|nr:hypothetical protein L1887_54486 [Cichorium endivia]
MPRCRCRWLWLWQQTRRFHLPIRPSLVSASSTPPCTPPPCVSELIRHHCDSARSPSAGVQRLIRHLGILHYNLPRRFAPALEHASSGLALVLLYPARAAKADPRPLPICSDRLGRTRVPPSLEDSALCPPGPCVFSALRVNAVPYYSV